MEGSVTRPRRDGGREEAPFSRWVRVQPDLEANLCSLTVNDVDMMFHKYRVGRWGRKVQMLLLVEVKCKNRVPNRNQQQTLFFQHQFCHGTKWLYDSRAPGKRRRVHNFGFFVLSLPGTTPEDDDLMRWGHFSTTGEIVFQVIDLPTLKDILAFRCSPYDFENLGLEEAT